MHAAAKLFSYGRNGFMRLKPFRNDRKLRPLAVPLQEFRRGVTSHEDLRDGQTLHKSDYTEDTSFHRTSVTIMNEDTDILYVNTVSNVGFTLNTGALVFGPIAIFPNALFSWNISGPADISSESLSLFALMEPKIDILVLGYGDPDGMSSISLQALRDIKNKGVSIECMPTEKAAPLYNFLAGEKRLVAGAFLPVRNMTMADVYMDGPRGAFDSTHVSRSALRGDLDETVAASMGGKKLPGGVDDMSSENFWKGIPEVGKMLNPKSIKKDE